MNYYAQLQSLVKEYQMKRQDNYVEQFKKIVWPILQERAKSGETDAYFCGMNRTFVESARDAGLLELFNFRIVNCNHLVVDWS